MTFSEELIERTAQAIERMYRVGHDAARRLALAALEGSYAHGGKP